MLLSETEKATFTHWLELHISTSKGIQEQMKKINTPDALLARERTEQAACLIVLRMITSGETIEVGS